MHRAGFEPARFSADELKSSSLTTRTSMLISKYISLSINKYIKYIYKSDH